MRDSLQQVGGREGDQVDQRVSDSSSPFLFLNLLKVELRKIVNPVRDLDDEEELGQVGELDVRILFPGGLERVQVVLSSEDLNTPGGRNQIERQQLATLVELARFRSGQVQFTVEFLWKEFESNQYRLN